MIKKIWQGEGEDMRGNSQAHVHLEGIVDAPLESSQGTNHDNTQRESTGEESSPAVTSLISLHMLHSTRPEAASSLPWQEVGGTKDGTNATTGDCVQIPHPSDPDEPVLHES